jgi:mRNA interferase MazF
VRRGEIWTVAGGVYASKPRPALIIQDDRFDVTTSVTACPLSTELRDAPLTRVPIEPTEANGLAQPSEIMVDRITTVRRTNVGERVGELTKQDMIRVEQSLLVFLGIVG